MKKYIVINKKGEMLCNYDVRHDHAWAYEKAMIFNSADEAEKELNESCLKNDVSAVIEIDLTEPLKEINK